MTERSHGPVLPFAVAFVLLLVALFVVEACETTPSDSDTEEGSGIDAVQSNSMPELLTSEPQALIVTATLEAPSVAKVLPTLPKLMVSPDIKIPVVEGTEEPGVSGSTREGSSPGKDAAGPQQTGEPDCRGPFPTGEPDGAILGYLGDGMGPGCTWSTTSTGLGGVTVQLQDLGGSVQMTTTTNTQGCYYFPNPSTSTIYNVVVPPSVASLVIACDTDGGPSERTKVVVGATDTWIGHIDFGYEPLH